MSAFPELALGWSLTVGNFDAGSRAIVQTSPAAFVTE
jgi:hypothetical protein